MKNNMPGEEQHSPEVTIDGPGSQLRRARERQGIEQSKVAAQLHLNPAMVQALEWDDYEKLPSAVFVQGYLRNYARLLGVDEDAVIRAYQALNPGTESVPLPRNQPDEVARELHSDHSMFRIFTWVVVLLMGVLIFFWWQGRIQLPETASMPTSDETTRGKGELPFQDQMSLAPMPSESGFSLPPEDAASSADGDAVGLDQGVGEQSIEAPVTTIPPMEEPPEAVEPAPLAIDDTTPASSLESAVETSQTTQSATAAGAVMFEFLGPCWVEVRDATGRARIIGEMRTGTTRNINGAGGPYQVVVGDIHAVRLLVNGEAFDMQPFARGKVARFTLDPAQL